MTNEPIEMKRIDLVLSGGQRVTVEVEAGLRGDCYFVLSVRKCGSSIFNNIVQALAQANHRKFVNVGDLFFRHNVMPREYKGDLALADMLYPQNVYGGFRDCPNALLSNPVFQSGKKLLVVRDPRDALVSEYFSNTYSHPIPTPSANGDAVVRQMERQRAEAQSLEIDDYVLRRARGMLMTMMEYSSTMTLPAVTVLTYEEFIFDKARFIRTVSDAFGWSAQPELIEQILSWADVRPVKEDPRAFIRNVTPGDHLRKLRPETVTKISEILRPAMILFGYAMPGQIGTP